MAIQVNGTTVIDNSRALTNITSVDSSVVSAMGSAGVGGATSLIQGLTTTSNTTALTFNLNSGYDVYYLNLYNIRHALSNQANSLWGRLGNSTGSLLSPSYSYWTQYCDGTQQDQRTESYFQFMSSNSWQPTSYSGEIDIRLKIANMEASNKRTFIEYYMMHRYDYGSGWFPARTVFGQATYKDAQVNKNITFYTEFGNQITNISYELWGVNL